MNKTPLNENNNEDCVLWNECMNLMDSAESTLALNHALVHTIKEFETKRLSHLDISDESKTDIKKKLQTTHYHLDIAEMLAKDSLVRFEKALECTKDLDPIDELNQMLLHNIYQELARRDDD